jgi:hypothetical protein
VLAAPLARRGGVTALDGLEDASLRGRDARTRLRHHRHQRVQRGRHQLQQRLVAHRQHAVAGGCGEPTEELGGLRGGLSVVLRRGGRKG